MQKKNIKSISKVSAELRVLFLTKSVSSRGGGVSTYIIEAARALINYGCDVQILTIADPFFKNDCPEDIPIRAFDGFRLFSSYGYSGAMRHFALKNFLDFDIIHTHTVWNYQLPLGGELAAKSDSKLVCTIHGMLEPWCLSRRRFKKWMARCLYADTNLRSADCLHATALKEALNVRKLGFKNPVAILSAGIDVAEFAVAGVRTDMVTIRWPELREKHILLFLSLVNPTKGLINLARVWGKICTGFQRWHLVIAGPDEDGHLVDVQRVISEFRAENQTTFTGPVYGDLKRQLYAACDLFVLPTHSENFGIVVAEALASGKPVITTKGAPWRELETYRCGWWIDIGIEPLEAALREAMELSDQQRAEMGLRGRRLVEDNYSWPKIALQMIEVYEWVLGKRDKPDYVRMD